MTSRRSSRLTAKAETTVVAATQLEEQLEQPSEKKQVKVTEKTTKSHGRHSVKKQKTSTSGKDSNDNVTADQSNRTEAKRENSGLLKDIPFDVLLEIFSHLKPEDLLHLSRVSKGLRDLLTSNDVSFLWKLAYKNLHFVNGSIWSRSVASEPPVCPDEANIVFYTDYLYGRHCQFCASANGRIYHESAFIRLCSKCAENSFLDKTNTSIGKLCNAWRYKGAAMILKVEYSLRSKEFKRAQKENRAESYVTERTRILQDRISVANVLVRWRRGMQQIQDQKLRAIWEKRRKDIEKKLDLEGYDTIHISDRVPHVRKSHELTDSEWTLIRVDVLNFLQDIRDNRALSNMRIGYQNRISQLKWFLSKPPWGIHPTPWWIASSEPITSFIKRGLPEGIPDNGFEEVEPQIRSLISSWREETDCYLASLIPLPSGKGKKKDTRDSKTSGLDLATTFFKCHWCTEPISYPRILMHGCLLKAANRASDEAGDEEGDENDMEDLEEDMVVDARGPQVPRPPKEITPDMVLPMVSDYYSLGMYAGREGVTYDEEASNVAREIITICGQEPMTVTYAAMEEVPARLECLRCSQAMQAKPKAKLRQLVMKWNMAIVHELQEHYDEPPSSEPVWRKVDSFEDLAKAEDAETNAKKLKKYQMCLACNHCSLFGISPQQSIGHMFYRHGITVDPVTVSDHFSPPEDTSVQILYPAVKI